MEGLILLGLYSKDSANQIFKTIGALLNLWMILHAFAQGYETKVVQLTFGPFYPAWTTGILSLFA
jgi:hypothetical protein